MGAVEISSTTLYVRIEIPTNLPPGLLEGEVVAAARLSSDANGRRGDPFGPFRTPVRILAPPLAEVLW